MPEFLSFARERIGQLVHCLKEKMPILDSFGHLHTKLDLSFRTLTDQFLKLETLEECSEVQLGRASLNDMKLRDCHVEQFLSSLNDSWEGELDLSGHLFGDETAIRISKLLQANAVLLTKVRLDGNKISSIGGKRLGLAIAKNRTLRSFSVGGVVLGEEGSNYLIEAISQNRRITHYDLGNIGDLSFRHLASELALPHHVVHLAFGEDAASSWAEQSKQQFDRVLRKVPRNTQILSVCISPADLERHYSFVSEVTLLCQKNRRLMLESRVDEYKSEALNTQNSKYYDPDNHELNAYKFSVKSYLQNVFGSLLDESLYMLQKERRNKLREEAIFQITKKVKNTPILEDICTADGSILVLAHFLLAKIKDA